MPVAYALSISAVVRHSPYPFATPESIQREFYRPFASPEGFVVPSMTQPEHSGANVRAYRRYTDDGVINYGNVPQVALGFPLRHSSNSEAATKSQMDDGEATIISPKNMPPSRSLGKQFDRFKGTFLLIFNSLWVSDCYKQACPVRISRSNSGPSLEAVGQAR